MIIGFLFKKLFLATTYLITSLLILIKDTIASERIRKFGDA